MGYRFLGGQNSNAANKFRAVVDPDADSNAGLSIHDKAIQLGVVKDADLVPTIFPDQSGLHLVSASVAAFNPPDAKVRACYTYSAVYYPNGGTAPATRPAASEATFTLHKTSTWLLWDITNGHVVPNCEASTA